MCGRFEVHSTPDVIARIFRITGSGAMPAPNYNIAPTQDIAIVVRDNGANRLAACSWGFLPPWAKDRSEGHRMINARAETVAEKPSFRAAFRDRRCLIIADGFYEWKKEGKLKKPVYVRLRSREPFGLAGLYTHWTPPEGGSICTCTIITTEANELLRPVHDRMPVIAPADRYDLWLDPSVQDRSALEDILRPFAPGALECYEVSSSVNSPANNSPENIMPLPGNSGK